MDRNVLLICRPHGIDLSLSARRAWIEIVISAMTSQISVVALRKESVDRNSFCRYPACCVVLVALRKESVDRNCCVEAQHLDDLVSLSARRAWIEILIALPETLNFTSLSARRAWIEISQK